MKKLFTLLLVLMVAFMLFGCGEDTNKTTIPSDPTYDYYLVTSLGDQKMDAIAFDDELIKSETFSTESLRYVYKAIGSTNSSNAVSVIRKNETKEQDFFDMGIDKAVLGSAVSFSADKGFRTAEAGKYQFFFFVYYDKVVLGAQLLEKGEYVPTAEELLAKVSTSNTSYVADGQKHEITISINYEGYEVVANGTVSYSEVGTYEVKYNIVKSDTQAVVAEYKTNLVILAAGTTTYTVSFEANGGTGTMAAQDKISGSFKLPNCAFKAPTGKSFAGWEVNGEVKAAGTTIEVTADTTVKATWKQEEQTYTVAFNANGGTGTMASQSKISGTFTLPNCTFTAPSGKQFAGWEVNGETKAAGSTIEVTADTIVKAIWEDINQGGGQEQGGQLPADGSDKLPTVDPMLQGNVQNGVILHAFLWSYNDIKNNMKMIAESGYSAVQTSPVQQPKDYHASYPTGWAEQWSKVYQPLSFSFATSGWLGTKAEFKAMCDEAHKYNVKVIVDIVSNHMANNVLTDADESNNNKKAQLYAGHFDQAIKAQLPGIKDFEPDLYNNQSKYVRSYTPASDNSAYDVTHGNCGWPDLDTSNSFVQGRVISLLQECIEAGADGFRFDAAKHIETPDDGDVASNFWPNIINASNSAAGSKQMYYYGEILNTPGNGRSYGSYTKYMSVTDNKTGNGILSAVRGHNASGAANANYNVGAANKAVLWAESHDTYAGGETLEASVSDVNKAWALVAARKDATALYFARPTNMGEMGKTDFASKEVVAVNLFHNLMVGASEYVGSSGSFAFVERKGSTYAGISIANVNGNATSINFKVNTLPDGDYYDQITGNKFTVSNKTLTGKMGDTGIAVLINKAPDLTPEVNISKQGGVFANSIEIDVKLEGAATNTKFYINNELKQELTADGKVTVTAPTNGDEIEVKFVTENSVKGYRNTQTYKFIRLDSAKEGAVIITDIPETYLNTSKYKLWAWVWQSGKDGRAIAGTIDGKYLVINGKKSNEDNILIVMTGSGQSAFEWKYAVMKTGDVALSPDNIASCPQSTWQKP